MVNVDVARCGHAKGCAKVETTDHAALAVVLNALLTCNRIALVGVYLNSVGSTLNEFCVLPVLLLKAVGMLGKAELNKRLDD